MPTVGSAISPIYIMLFLSACSVQKTPELPDLQQKTFSSEEILQKKKELEEKVRKMHENS